MFFTTRLIRFLQIGVGISNTDVEYADSTNSTEAPTTGWQTNAPKWQNGHFIWTRTHIAYTDGRDKYTAPVCLPSGKGIDHIVEQYYSSTNATSLENDEWSTAAPAWVDGRYIWTRSVIYYTDGTSVTTSPICTTGFKGARGDPGEAGKDAITITMSLAAICHHKSSSDSKYTTEVKMFEGDKQVPFIHSYTDDCDGVSISSVKKGDGRIFYLIVKAGAIVNQQIKLYFGYKDKTYQRVIPISTAVDGDPGAKGEVGAALRGPQSWSDLGEGYTFEAGNAGDEWKDVVIYGDIYYSCVKGHVKTVDNYPGSPEDNNNGYWRAGKPMEIIATKILLAKFLQVDNLGAGAVVMKKDGKVVFKAEGGDVECNGGKFNNIIAENGTFQNANVSGDIEVFRLKYRSNRTNVDGVMAGSFISGSGSYILPHLEADEHMKVVVANPIMTRSTPPVVLTCENTKDVFLPANGSMLTDATTTISAYGWCELIGVGYGQRTIWMYNVIKE